MCGTGTDHRPHGATGGHDHPHAHGAAFAQALDRRLAQAPAPAVEPGADWHLRGEWFDVCSCSLPCPCTFAQAPTGGACLFTLAWQVHEGHYGGTDLSGLGVVALGQFQGNMWIDDPDALMTLMFYIDAKGGPAQRQALERIFTGKEGGWPGTFGSLIGELRAVEHAPIDFRAEADLSSWQVEIPDLVRARATALTGPTADPSRRVQLHNAPGAEVGPGQVATWGVVQEDHAVGFTFSHPYKGGSSKHFAFDWRP
ncbi:DUF1326 domain-containing protein [Nocardiopsis sp. RSe5-2]|uniref:DUF1326 domain-containing protein n=1 Tax=Nocardiopsis endophytica TaxID=3018445 RepID=A0ABT4TYJ7_9ACTN|nr:DUF1326 domain-containing protein [Nocardiopsis endophytica]MDA2809777.1 DUF1326 domain-containing protein [Nocardiopsis endophytica]